MKSQKLALCLVLSCLLSACFAPYQIPNDTATAILEVDEAIFFPDAYLGKKQILFAITDRFDEKGCGVDFGRMIRSKLPSTGLPVVAGKEIGILYRHVDITRNYDTAVHRICAPAMAATLTEGQRYRLNIDDCKMSITELGQDDDQKFVPFIPLVGAKSPGKYTAEQWHGYCKYSPERFKKHGLQVSG